MLSDFYNIPFEQMLKDYIKGIKSSENKDLIEKKYTLFYPSIGKDYMKNRELLVVGQATSNWNVEENSWDISKAEKDFQKIIKNSIEESGEGKKGECPLEWINENWKKSKSLSSSFFWNIIYELVEKQYNRTEKNWNNIIAYTNLMKISPFPTGNPNGNEKYYQTKNAAQLFKLELEELHPKNCLIITNLKNWAEPILVEAGIKFKPENGNYVEATAEYKRCNIIVTKRPPPMYPFKHQPFIDEVSKFIVNERSNFFHGDNNDFGKMYPGVE